MSKLVSSLEGNCSCTQSICAQSLTKVELIAADAPTKVTKHLQFVLHELRHAQHEPTAAYERYGHYLFTQWFEVWDQRNLDCHCHDCQGRANKLKDVAFREITHLYTFKERVPE